MAQIIAKSRWLRLIPVAFITYSLAYLDRANYSFGVAGGMKEDLNIDAAMSSLLGSLFFLGYFFFQIPGAIYAANKSAKKLILRARSQKPTFLVGFLFTGYLVLLSRDRYPSPIR